MNAELSTCEIFPNGGTTVHSTELCLGVYLLICGIPLPPSLLPTIRPMQLFSWCIFWISTDAGTYRVGLDYNYRKCLHYILGECKALGRAKVMVMNVYM